MNYKDLLAKDNEDWNSALEKYLTLFKLDLSSYMHIDSDIYEEYGLDNGTYFSMESLETDEEFEHLFYNLDYQPTTFSVGNHLENLELIISKNIPTSLKELYLKHGAFSINSNHDCPDSFRLYSPSQTEIFSDPSKSFMLDEFFFKSTNTLSPEELNNLHNRFLFFGSGFNNEGSTRFLLYFFDYEKELYGELSILADECDKMKRIIFPSLFDGRLSNFCFDELIRNQINRLILMKLLNPDYGFLSPYDFEKDCFYNLVANCPVINLSI